MNLNELSHEYLLEFYWYKKFDFIHNATSLSICK